MPRKKASKATNPRAVLIGERIVQTRKLRGLTQSALARRAKINQVSLWRYEHGTMCPGLDMQDKLADALQVDVRWLRDGTPTLAPAVLDPPPRPEPPVPGALWRMVNRIAVERPELMPITEEEQLELSRRHLAGDALTPVRLEVALTTIRLDRDPKAENVAACQLSLERLRAEEESR